MALWQPKYYISQFVEFKCLDDLSFNLESGNFVAHICNFWQQWVIDGISTPVEVLVLEEISPLSQFQ